MEGLVNQEHLHWTFTSFQLPTPGLFVASVQPGSCHPERLCTRTDQQPWQAREHELIISLSQTFGGEICQKKIAHLRSPEMPSVLLFVSDHLCLCFPPCWPLSTDGDDIALSPIKLKRNCHSRFPGGITPWFLELPLTGGIQGRAVGGQPRECDPTAESGKAQCPVWTICAFISRTEPAVHYLYKWSRKCSRQGSLSWRALSRLGALPPHLPSDYVLFQAAFPIVSYETVFRKC